MCDLTFDLRDLLLAVRQLCLLLRDLPRYFLVLELKLSFVTCELLNCGKCIFPSVEESSDSGGPGQRQQTLLEDQRCHNLVMPLGLSHAGVLSECPKRSFKPQVPSVVLGPDYFGHQRLDFVQHELTLHQCVSFVNLSHLTPIPTVCKRES